MSLKRHTTECIHKKTGTGIPTPVNAIGLSYSLLSCSPAELNFASLNDVNVVKLNSTV